MSDEGDAKDYYGAVIVGAGWAGMYLLYHLRKLGLDVRVFEAGTGVGGTWYWNRYPGARCDVQSLEYSFSFSEALEQEWEWSERYAAQPEIERYANHVAERFDLLKDIQFSSKVTAAQYDEGSGTWSIETDRGDRVRAKYFVLAVGGYSVPIKPDIPGIDSYSGELYFTSKWPKEEVRFAGKRVGVIGIGTSGMQACTVIANQNVAELYVFQRTANFALPAQNGPLAPDFVRTYKKSYREHREAARQTGFGVNFPIKARSVRDLPEKEFLDQMEAAWKHGGSAVLGLVADLVTDEAANARVANYLRAKVRERVNDPEVAELLCANDHFVGTRRAMIETGYFEIFNQPNVSLVNLKKTPIKRITPTGVETSDANYDLDIIVMATGFDSGTGGALQIAITGKKQDITLAKKWSHGPTTYLGLMVHGFPNLFFLAQPGSPSIRSHVMVAIEQQGEWLTELIRDMEATGIETIEPSRDAEADWTKHVADIAASTLVTRQATQYVGANVPGKPRVYLAYLGGLANYGAICDAVRNKNYEGFIRTSSGGELPGKHKWSGPLSRANAHAGGKVI